MTNLIAPVLQEASSIGPAALELAGVVGAKLLDSSILGNKSGSSFEVEQFFASLATDETRSLVSRVVKEIIEMPSSSLAIRTKTVFLRTLGSKIPILKLFIEDSLESQQLDYERNKPLIEALIKRAMTPENLSKGSLTLLSALRDFLEAFEEVEFDPNPKVVQQHFLDALGIEGSLDEFMQTCQKEVREFAVQIAKNSYLLTKENVNHWHRFVAWFIGGIVKMFAMSFIESAHAAGMSALRGLNPTKQHTVELQMKAINSYHVIHWLLIHRLVRAFSQ